MYNQQVVIKDAGGYGYKLDADKVMTDDITMRHEHQIGYSQLWLIGNEFGPICAVWAATTQEALDAAVDADMLDSLLIDENDICKQDPTIARDSLSGYRSDEYIRAGNASEAFSSVYLWVKLAPIGEQTTLVQIRFAECRGAAVDNMGAL